jgi:hypothetical protein
MVGGPSNNDEANSGCEAGVVVEEKRVATGIAKKLVLRGCRAMSRASRLSRCANGGATSSRREDGKRPMAERAKPKVARGC